MSNAAKVSNFLDKAKVFYFLTTEGDQPKGRPFSFHLLSDDKLYFGCGTFKDVYKQLEQNPKIEILAMADGEFLRYDDNGFPNVKAMLRGKMEVLTDRR